MNNSLVASRQSAAAKNEVSLKLFDIRFSRHAVAIWQKKSFSAISVMSEKPIAQQPFFLLSPFFSEGGSCAKILANKRG